MIFCLLLVVSIYKLGDFGISNNLIGSLSLTNGHCPPPGGWIMKQRPAGINFVLPKELRNDILRMQNITIPNDTKKAMNLQMKVSREKHCFNTQFAHTSSVFCLDRQVLLMLLSWSNNNIVLRQIHFKVPFKSAHLPFNKTSPFTSLNVAFSLENDCDFLHSNNKHMASFPEETS